MFCILYNRIICEKQNKIFKKNIKKIIDKIKQICYNIDIRLREINNRKKGIKDYDRIEVSTKGNSKAG